MSTQPAVHVHNVSKAYGTTTALDGITLEIPAGSRTVILGHNGAGKSTLLEILATLREPTTGTVTIHGHNTRDHTRQARQLIGLTPQSNALDPLATLTEALNFQGAAHGLPRAISRKRTQELIELFGLTEHRTKRISKLSGGTRRKVDLAVALVTQPPVVILDEPTTGLDPVSRLEFWDELKRLNTQGTTLIVSTQDLHEAEVLATDIIVVKNGQIAAHGTPSQLKERVGQRTLIVECADLNQANNLATHAQASADMPEFRSDPDNPAVLRLALENSQDALTNAIASIATHTQGIKELTIAEPTLDDVFVALAAR